MCSSIGLGTFKSMILFILPNSPWAWRTSTFPDFPFEISEGIELGKGNILKVTWLKDGEPGFQPRPQRFQSLYLPHLIHYSFERK